MSPLLGATGGSSEYAFRGTLDDWPTPFATALSAQNNLGTLSPTGVTTAFLTVTGLNYKARIIVDQSNSTVSTDGGLTYVSAGSTYTPVFVRDNQIVRIKLQPTSGSDTDFNKSYTIPVKIGKRTGTWQVSTRIIDQTPNNFSFNGLIDQQIGIALTSNTVTIAGLESGFSFPISVTNVLNLAGVGVSIIKNNSSIGVSGTVANGDQIYLSSTTPNLYGQTTVFNTQVGTFSTTWGFITRNVDVLIDPFSFVGVSSANKIGAAYTSSAITISGADPGPTIDPPNPLIDLTALPVSISGPNAFYEIRTGTANSLRYPNGTNPNNWQNTPGFAYNGDTIRVQINASNSYNTTVTGILTVSNQSASYIVTTRPTPFNTIPNTFTFTPDLTDQPRSGLVTSNPITISGLTTGFSGRASISAFSPTGIAASFNVNNGPWINIPSVPVSNNDQIRLRLQTPSQATNNGVSDSTIVFQVAGENTFIEPLNSIEGYNVTSLIREDIWTVSTIARNCPITISPLTNRSGVQTNTLQNIDFQVGGYEFDCDMAVNLYRSIPTNLPTADFNFTRIVSPNGSVVTGNTKSYSNVASGSTITLSVRSSQLFETDVRVSIGVSNVVSQTTNPAQISYTSWTITSVGNTAPWQLSLTATPNPTIGELYDLPTDTVQVNTPIALSWTSVNCTDIRDVTWNPPISATAVSGTANTNAPPTPTTVSYTINAYINPLSSTYTSGTLDGVTNRYYATATQTFTVVPDFYPLFNPTTFPVFASATNQDPSPSILAPNVITSSTLQVSDITTPIKVDVLSGPESSGALFSDNTTTKDILANVTTNLNVKVNSPLGFVSTSSALLNFYIPGDPTIYPGGKRPVAQQRRFEVTTRECIPDVGTYTYPSALEPNRFSIQYYLTSSYTTTTGSQGGGDLIFNPNDAGNLTIPNTSSAATYLSNASGGLNSGIWGNGIAATWSEIIIAIYNTFASSANIGTTTARPNRPPTTAEVNQLITSLISDNTSNYLNVGAWRTAVVVTQAQNAAITVKRSTSTVASPNPILNSCSVRAATVGTIQQLNYSNVV